MNKIKIFLLMSLGFVLRSCCYYVYPSSATAASQTVIAEMPTTNPGWYTRTGTEYHGQKAYPNALIWKDMSITRNGLVVTINAEGRRIVIDMRNTDSGFSKTYKATSMTHKPISVYVSIGGLYDNYVVVDDGVNTETYWLRR